MFSRHSYNMVPWGLCTLFPMPQEKPTATEDTCRASISQSLRGPGTLGGKVEGWVALKKIPRMPVGTGCPESCPGLLWKIFVFLCKASSHQNSTL